MTPRLSGSMWSDEIVEKKHQLNDVVYPVIVQWYRDIDVASFSGAGRAEKQQWSPLQNLGGFYKRYVIV